MEAIIVYPSNWKERLYMRFIKKWEPYTDAIGRRGFIKRRKYLSTRYIKSY